MYCLAPPLRGIHVEKLANEWDDYDLRMHRNYVQLFNLTNANFIRKNYKTKEDKFSMANALGLSCVSAHNTLSKNNYNNSSKTHTIKMLLSTVIIKRLLKFNIR